MGGSSSLGIKNVFVHAHEFQAYQFERLWTSIFGHLLYDLHIQMIDKANGRPNEMKEA